MLLLKRENGKYKEVKMNKKNNPWLIHVKEVKKANPKKSLKECLKIASKTYKKK